VRKAQTSTPTTENTRDQNSQHQPVRTSWPAKPSLALASRALDALLALGVAAFLAVLPFHLVIKRLVPGPMGTYWKEGLLGVLIVLWIVQWIVARIALRTHDRRRPLLSGTPLDGAVLAYLALLVLRFALDRSGWVGAWGLYVSVLYLPLFWLVPAALRTRPRAETGYAQALWLVVLLVGIGGIVALGGLVEFALDVPLWPSDEITQRLGHPDFYVYGTHVRRVYFTLDSPTALANTLALLLPLAVAMALTQPFTSSTRGLGTEIRTFGSAMLGSAWVRAGMGVSAILMAACIIVTFSRGIWVATALSLLAMGALSYSVHGSVRHSVHRYLKPALAVGAVLILVGATIALASTRSKDLLATTERVVELSSPAYAAAPAFKAGADLLATQPLHGERVVQTWTLPDPIAGGEDTRRVLYEHPPQSGKAEIIYRVEVAERSSTERAALRFAIAMAPQVWSPEYGDGTSFQIYLSNVDPLPAADAPERDQFLFVRYINPKHNPSDRRWRNYLLDLSPWAGRAVNLHLITEGGPADDWAYDWSGWADLEMVRVDRRIFADRALSLRPPQGVLLRHARSIGDWVRDETNRDRLAAWNLALVAWRAAPLWGLGLGRTGAAALRTNPQGAFVTESQVLKALVELGLPGLLALGYLWFQILRVGYRSLFVRRTVAVRQTPFARRPHGSADDTVDKTSGLRRALLLGIITGLLVVFVEGWVYQNLEVKQVNAFFWTLTGLLAFLAWRPSTDG
jgi:hypothetical protein